MIGRSLSHYKVLEEISRGGMGIVYKALDVKLNREVALKVLPPELVSDPERKRRFVQEAQAAAALKHPNVAVIYEIDEVNGVSFIAAELIEGRQLGEIASESRLPVLTIVEIAIEIAEGLSRAHEKSIVHRDLKPSNVMVTEDGHAKIIDFGLAKLLEPIGTGSELQTAIREGTEAGVLLGTAPYMSPEQARGETIDGRSDIFSLGIVLYEMLAGERPFLASSVPETLSAIINAPAPPLPDSIAREATPELRQILSRCLAKAREERYQTAKQLAADLRAVRRKIDPDSVSSSLRAPFRRVSMLSAAAIVFGALLTGAAIFLMRSAPPRPEAEVTVTKSKPSIAVLLFDNLSDDMSLDWLRFGITEMLVTDLSQSPGIEVLGTDRVVEILEQLNRMDERVTSFTVVREMAERADVDTVLLGSFVKVDDSIRIHVRLQEAASGAIVSTERVEGTGESSLFSMVDDLTRRIKSDLSILPEDSAQADHDLRDVTTASIEAYRQYAEGIHLHLRLKSDDALQFLERAVDLDPGFAMALAKLGTIHSNLGNYLKYREYTERALEHSDRLPTRERFYIEGNYYARLETIHRSIEGYQDALDLYPDHISSRHNLALRYSSLERYDEAVEQLEEARRRRTKFAGTYGMLATSYAALGQFEAGNDVLVDYLRENPDNSYGHYSLGRNLTHWGRFDVALQALEKASSLDPEALEPLLGFLRLYILIEDWPEAGSVAGQMRESTSSYTEWVGKIMSARLLLYQGRSREALDLLEEASGYSDWYPVTRSFIAHLLLQSGRPDRAVAAGRQAQRAVIENVPMIAGQAWWVRPVQSQFPVIVSLARVDLEAAKREAGEFRQKAFSLPTDKEKRRYHHIAGELALLERNPERAIEELTEARSMLSSRGNSSVRMPPQHVPIWFSLASAYLATDDDERAREWFVRIVESTSERVDWPIRYVRSLYFLGKIHEDLGEEGKAREYYERFVDLWKDGDMDRERVEEATTKIS